MASEKQIQAAFNDGVKSIVDGAKYGALRDAIARGDYAAAIDSVGIEDAAFDDMRQLIMQTYAEAGINEITGRKWDVPVRYNSASPYAERYARNVVGNRITLMTYDMKDAVRFTIGDGIAFGRSNNRIALDIVGRIGASGRRTGGIVGMNAQQAQWVANMRRYIEAGDINAVMGMTRRDKRYDKMIAKGGLSSAQVDKIIGRYNDRLLQSRGLTIARTERGAAVNNGVMDAWRQAADKVGFPYSRLIKSWKHGVTRDPRAWHIVVPPVVGLDTPFTLSNGTLIQCPHAVGADPREVINCSCRVSIRLPKNG